MIVKVQRILGRPRGRSLAAGTVKQMIPPPVSIFFDDGAIVMTDDSLLQKGVVKL
jgi:hypothetical protein